MPIELLQVPKGGGEAYQAGIFSLPSEFDTKALAAKWVKKGNAVGVAEQREHLVGTRLTADGWKVWKDKSGKIFSAHASSGEHVLLCRPREIQDAVNAIYGNVGKERMVAEKRGETTGGVPISDPGILGDNVLEKVIGKEDLGDGEVVFNQVSDVRRVTTSPLETNS